MAYRADYPTREPPVKPSLPCFAVSFSEQTSTATSKAYSNLLPQHPDGNVTWNQGLLENLISTIRDRARSRGSSHVTDRDVRDGAALLTSPESNVVSSPADEIIAHNEALQAKLALVHADVDTFKSGGGRAPKVLVLGETSGVIARAFLNAGADVATCDLQTSTSPEIPHFKGDFSYICDKGWDLVIGHPPRNYLSNAGVRYLYTEEGRMDRVKVAAAVFNRMHASQTPPRSHQATDNPSTRQGPSQPTQAKPVHTTVATRHETTTALYLTVEHKPGVEHTDADGVSRLVAPVSQLNTTDTAAATTILVGALSRAATSIPDHDPGISGNAYVNPDGRPSRSQLLLLLDTTVQSPDPLVYTWYHQGLLDTPGATRSTQDECDAHASTTWSSPKDSSDESPIR